MSTTTYLTDALTRHQVFLQRRAGGIYRDLLPILRSMQADIIARLQGEPAEFQQFRLRILLRELDGIVSASTNQFAQQLQLELEELADYEAGFAQRLMVGATTAEWVLPTAEQIAAVVVNTPMVLVSGQTVEALTLTEMITQFDASAKRAIRGAIQAGVIEGQTVEQVSRRVQQLAGDRTRRQAEAVVRTATNAITDEARKQVYNANADVLSGVKWVSTLDSRTSLLCLGRDGRTFPLDSGPRPPAHYNCRSVVIPVVDPAFTIPGLEGERASVGGPVPASTTYNSWLKRQPESFQVAVLGKERAELFRKGVHVAKFTDEAGRTISLDDLKRMEGITLE